jgi:hypothetical protein
MPEIIQYDDHILAIIIRSDYQVAGIRFFTPDHFPQQLGYMNRPKGYCIQPHIHPEVHLSISHIQEALFIRSGKVKVLLYTNELRFFHETVIERGDVILLASGGHSFEMLEDSEIIEVKQGPYNGVEKIMFKPEPEKTVAD